MTGSMKIEEAKSFYNGIRKTDKCIFSKSCNQKLLVGT